MNFCWLKITNDKNIVYIFILTYQSRVRRAAARSWTPSRWTADWPADQLSPHSDQSPQRPESPILHKYNLLFSTRGLATSDQCELYIYITVVALVLVAAVWSSFWAPFTKHLQSSENPIQKLVNGRVIANNDDDVLFYLFSFF